MTLQWARVQIMNQNLRLICYMCATQEHLWYSEGDNTLFLCTEEIARIHFLTRQKLVKAESLYIQKRLCQSSIYLEGVKNSSSKYSFTYVIQVQATQLS